MNEAVDNNAPINQGVDMYGRQKPDLLSPRECARLMGLPDSYRLPSSQNAGLMVAGDGVVAPVVGHLARELLEPLLAAPASPVAAE